MKQHQIKHKKHDTWKTLRNKQKHMSVVREKAQNNKITTKQKTRTRKTETYKTNEKQQI